MPMYLIINFYPEKYHSIHSTLFFKSHLFQICRNQSLPIHSDVKKHNVFHEKNKCKVDLDNITSLHKQELFKMNREQFAAISPSSLPFTQVMFSVVSIFKQQI